MSGLFIVWGLIMKYLVFGHNGNIVGLRREFSSAQASCHPPLRPALMPSLPGLHLSHRLDPSPQERIIAEDWVDSPVGRKVVESLTPGGGHLSPQMLSDACTARRKYLSPDYLPVIVDYARRASTCSKSPSKEGLRGVLGALEKTAMAEHHKHPFCERSSSFS